MLTMFSCMDNLKKKELCIYAGEEVRTVQSFQLTEPKALFFLDIVNMAINFVPHTNKKRKTRHQFTIDGTLCR